MNLSDHFPLSELTRSRTAERNSIINMPRQEEILSLKMVCENILEPVRLHYGIPFIPSSGFRCLELNRLIGSKDTSQHVKGEAVDFEVPGISNRDLFDWCVANLDFDQAILEFHNPNIPDSGWVHCSYVQHGNRHDAKEIG